MNSRRQFLKAVGLAGGAVAASLVNRAAMAALPEPVIHTKTETMPPLAPNHGRPYNPVVTINGWTLPWRTISRLGAKSLPLAARALKICNSLKYS